jgi:hypothetical protein
LKNRERASGGIGEWEKKINNNINEKRRIKGKIVG